MPSHTAPALLKRVAVGFQIVDQCRPIWRQIAELILPQHSLIGSNPLPTTQGARRTQRLMDSTAVHANRLLAASMLGSFTPDNIRWAGLRHSEPEINKVSEAATWMDDCASRIFAAYGDSNFYAETYAMDLELGGFGTGALYMEELSPKEQGGFGGLRFKALPMGTYAIEEDANGNVNALFYKYRISAQAAKAAKYRMTEKLAGAMQNNPNQEFEFVHAVTPSSDGSWYSCYIEVASKEKVSEGRFFEFPFLVPRWEKYACEVFGRGPGHTALPDVQTLNRLKELTLKAANKAVDPPMEALDDGVIGTPNLTPSSVNTVREMGALKAIQFNAKFDVSQLETEDLRQSVRFIFYWDQLQPLGAGVKSGNPITATEVSERIELMQRVLGPTLSRLRSEFLSPLVNRTFALMYRAGALPEAPQIIKDAAKARRGDIGVVYEGPLARAQRAGDLTAIQRTFMTLAPMEEKHPEVADPYDFTETATIIGEINGFPPRAMRDAEGIKRLQESRAQAAAEAEAKANAAQVAESAGKLGPLLKAAQQPPGGEQQAA